MTDYKKLAQEFIEKNPNATKAQAESYAREKFTDKKDIIAFVTMWFTQNARATRERSRNPREGLAVP